MSPSSSEPDAHQALQEPIPVLELVLIGSLLTLLLHPPAPAYVMHYLQAAAICGILWSAVRHHPLFWLGLAAAQGERNHRRGLRRAGAGGPRSAAAERAPTPGGRRHAPHRSAEDDAGRAAQAADWQRAGPVALHTQFEVERGVPAQIDVTPNGGGEYDERAVLARTLRPDVTYVTDRGFSKYQLFNQIVAMGSSYVCRARDNISFEVALERPLSEEAQAAGVLRDGARNSDV